MKRIKRERFEQDQSQEGAAQSEEGNDDNEVENSDSDSTGSFHRPEYLDDDANVAAFQKVKARLGDTASVSNATPSNRIPADARQQTIQAGFLKEVVLQNFMNHENLQVNFGDRLNFITGDNGSESKNQRRGTRRAYKV
jgi:hypothetical protein